MYYKTIDDNTFGQIFFYKNNNDLNMEYFDTNKDINKDKVKRYENLYDRDVVGEFKKMQKEIMDKETPILSKLLAETNFDPGYESLAEKYFNQLYEKYGVIACTILQNIYLYNMYDNSHILKHLLFIVENLEKDEIENLEIIPLAGIGNPDIEIQDLSVKCLEEWGDKRHIPTLIKKRDETKIGWFKDYIDDVILELKEE